MTAQQLRDRYAGFVKQRAETLRMTPLDAKKALIAMYDAELARIKEQG